MSIFRSPELRSRVTAMYEQMLGSWPVAFEEVFVPTRFGKVHVVVSGPEGGEPIMLFHAASMAAVSWGPNVGRLSDAGYRSYAIDHIGEANLSELDDDRIFPRSPEEIGELYVEVADALSIERSAAIGASAGGHAAMRYALADPSRVSALGLLGPMGVNPLGFAAIGRMMAVSVRPSDARVRRTSRWALGESPQVVSPYGDWFSIVLRAVAFPPRVGRPVALRPEEMRRLDLPVLLVLGERDPLVGSPGRAAQRAASFPDLRVEVVDSAHLVNVEQADVVNEWLIDLMKEVVR